MTTYSYPTSPTFQPTRQDLVVSVNQESTKSVLSGDSQTITRPGSRWGWDMQIGPVTPDELATVEAFFVRLNGREHRTSIHDFLRPVPRGNILLTGVVVNGSAAQFATTVSLRNCGAARTLLAGDWLKLGTQLVMCVADATANGSGIMTVEFRHMLRTALTDGTTVVLDKPTTDYVLTDSTFQTSRIDTYAQEGPGFRLEEDF